VIGTVSFMFLHFLDIKSMFLIERSQ
jgi:hypothetical protein